MSLSSSIHTRPRIGLHSHSTTGTRVSHSLPKSLTESNPAIGTKPNRGFLARERRNPCLPKGVLTAQPIGPPSSAGALLAAGAESRTHAMDAGFAGIRIVGLLGGGRVGKVRYSVLRTLSTPYSQ